MFVEVSELQMRYPGQAQPALQAVTLGLRAGQIGVLIGPSGCGKTSLLRALAGLEPVTHGVVRIAGRVVGSATLCVPPEQRRMGMVFQEPALFPHLSVARNVAFGIHRMARAAQAARVDQVLRLVGLQGCEQRFAHQLSGGQQQRVALARALAPRPQLLLLDEPFSNLDVELRARLAQELRAILQAAGATALLVTHDQLEAFAIGDLIGVLHAGQLHQWADAHTLYQRPATRFVADFTGNGVFTPAALVRRGAGLVAQTPLGDLPAAHCAALADSSYPGGACDLLLRADDIVHDEQAPLRAQLLHKSFRGARYLYTLRLASGHGLLAHVPSHHEHAPGQWIGIRAQPRQLVTFPRV